MFNVSVVEPRPLKFDSANSLFGNVHQIFFHAIVHLANLLLMIDSFICSLMLLLLCQDYTL